jgi:DNA-binding transcriptional LysR family regulator
MFVAETKSNSPAANASFSIKGIENFVRTAEAGSFAKAALELGVSAVAVSENISRLERSLGVRLLARSTRELRITPEGQAFLEQCTQPLRQLEEACREVAAATAEPSGLVRVTLVSAVAHLFVVPELPKFLAQYPHINVQLELSEEVTPMIAQRFDVGIRVGQLNDAGYVARPLGNLYMPMVASPAYLAAAGTPQTLDDLARHQLLQQHVPGRDQRFWLIQEPDPDTGKPRLRFMNLPARLVCNDQLSLLRATQDGVGIGQLPQPLVLPALQSGALVQVLPQYAPEGLQIFLHYPSRKQLPARVRAFVDFFTAGLVGHADFEKFAVPAAAAAGSVKAVKRK